MGETLSLEEKIEAIKFTPSKWIQGAESPVHSMIRVEAYKLIDAPKGMNTGVSNSLDDTLDALKGFEDIWSVKFDEDRKEVRITRI